MCSMLIDLVPHHVKFVFFVGCVFGARTLLLEVGRASQPDTSQHFVTKSLTLPAACG